MSSMQRDSYTFVQNRLILKKETCFLQKAIDKIKIIGYNRYVLKNPYSLV